MISTKELAEIIKRNPGCVATIDNDEWWIIDTKGHELVSGGKYPYGGDILRALALIVGIGIEEV